MWNSDAFGYDASTDPLYVTVPFYIDMRSGVSYGVFLDNTYRSNFDVGHQTEGVLSFGADGGALDYYFIYGPEPKKVLQRYTTLTGRMPIPPLSSRNPQCLRHAHEPLDMPAGGAPVVLPPHGAAQYSATVAFDTIVPVVPGRITYSEAP